MRGTPDSDKNEVDLYYKGTKIFETKLVASVTVDDKSPDLIRFTILEKIGILLGILSNWFWGEVVKCLSVFLKMSA